VTLHILLDSSPLGLLSIPARGTAAPIAHWAAACLAAGHELYVPEVIDYELRRELLRAGKVNSVRELDRLKSALNFLPINSAAMLFAADLWAKSRQGGLATGDPKKLDIDVILAAQALTLGIPASDLVVATSNVAHLARFVPADLWSNIKP
jgi:predicted nucleic acid-binding protein